MLVVDVRGEISSAPFEAPFGTTHQLFYYLRFMDSVDLSIDINYYIYLRDFSLKLFIWPPHNYQFLKV